MRKIHMTKLLISAAMLMVGLAVQAQVYTEFNMTGKKSADVHYTKSGINLNKMDKHQYGYMTVYTPKQELKAPKKAEPGEVNLTFNLVYDPDVFWTPYTVYIIDENNNMKSAWRMGEDVITTTVAPGTYDFVICYQSMEKGDLYYVIREQVEVTEDATFTLSAEEATNHISFVNYGPDGNVLKHDLLGYDEETGAPILLEKGDIETTDIENQVYLKGMGSLGSYSHWVVSAWPEELRTAPFSEYYVNDVSDRYVFTQSRTCHNDEFDVWYLSYFSTDDVHAGAIANNPEDYVLCHENYQFSPKGQNEPGYGAGVVLYAIKNGKYASNSGLLSGFPLRAKQDDTFSFDVYNGIPFVNPDDESVNLLVGPLFSDYYGVVQDVWGNENYDCVDLTIGSPYFIENGQQIFHNVGPINSYYTPCGKNRVLAENTTKIQVLPAPAAFTYPAEERLGTVGDNCPINAIDVMSYHDDYQGDVTNFGDKFVGRYGETRLYNDDEVNIALKFNGEEIEDPNNWSRDSKGTWEYTVTNTNIEVDGLPGENKTVVYYDETNEESTFPGIEMMHFRSDAGVTDRFATAAEGMMEFMGGDFKYNYYPEYWAGVFDCQPMDVTVEYAPYGTDNWKALPVEEVPELYQMPGWGYFYRASLASVTGTAMMGWFDVRFKLQDEAGNWQEQVVSPAFRIDDLVSTAVEEVEAVTDAREVARYSVDGRQLSAPQPGVNIIKMSDGTSKKVWVK